MRNQSSIELLFDWIEANMHEDNFNILSAKEKAIQMHKEEIKSAYLQGGTDVHCKRYKGTHEYYQETYGGSPKTSDN